MAFESIGKLELYAYVVGGDDTGDAMISGYFDAQGEMNLFLGSLSKMAVLRPKVEEVVRSTGRRHVLVKLEVTEEAEVVEVGETTQPFIVRYATQSEGTALEEIGGDNERD